MLLALEKVVPARALARLVASVDAQALATIEGALAADRRLQAALLPARQSAISVHRYAIGSEEGFHAEPELVGWAPRLRPDVAVWLSLSETSAVEGGDLVIDWNGVEKVWQPAAGDCFVFPAGARRRVTPVTRGERWLAFFCAQSVVRDPGERRVLYDLAGAMAGLSKSQATAPEAKALARVQADLQRLWAEPAQKE